MLYLLLVVAFFVGGAITGVFSENDVEAETDISTTDMVEDFGLALSSTSSDGEKMDGEHEGKSCPFKNKKSNSFNTGSDI